MRERRRRYTDKELEKTIQYLIDHPSERVVWSKARTEKKPTESDTQVSMRRSVWNARARTVFHGIGAATHKLTIVWTEDGDCVLGAEKKS